MAKAPDLFRWCDVLSALGYSRNLSSWDGGDFKAIQEKFSGKYFNQFFERVKE